jgi:hypothetical protein
MQAISFRTGVLVSVALVLLPSSRSSAESFCPDCVAAVFGAAVGLGAGIGTGIYLVHRNHTSLTGCVTQTGDGLSLTTENGSNYELMNAPSDVKAHRRVSLRGHKIKVSLRHAFWVDHLSRDHGACG